VEPWIQQVETNCTLDHCKRLRTKVDLPMKSNDFHAFPASSSIHHQPEVVVVVVVVVEVEVEVAATISLLDSNFPSLVIFSLVSVTPTLLLFSFVPFLLFD
jgi:hypothetical protein